MRILVKKSIKIFIFSELIVLLSSFISYKFFLNAQVAFLSSFFVFLGSMYSYKRLVDKKVENEIIIEDERDELDKLDDPHALFEEIEQKEGTVEELKAVIKEEKQNMKGDNIKNSVKASSGTVSFFRLIPYLFLIVGFIALQNNHNLEVLPFLLFITFGMPVGYLAGKEIFSIKK
jgi:Ca2+/Na+ antiporter